MLLNNDSKQLPTKRELVLPCIYFPLLDKILNLNTVSFVAFTQLISIYFIRTLYSIPIHLGFNGTK